MSASAYAGARITGRSVKDGSLTGKDIKNYSLGLSKLSNGAVIGLAGDPGHRGPAGAAGAPGFSGLQVVDSPHLTLPSGANTPIGWLAQCPAGKVVVGTGFYSSVTDVGFVKSYG